MTKIYCSKCGMAYEVSKSLTNAYMFCLACDQFFKVDKKIKVPDEKIHTSTISKPSQTERAEAAKAANKKKKLLANAMQKMQIREILSFVMQKKPSKETLTSVMKIMRSSQNLTKRLRIVFKKFFIFKTSESEPDSDLTLLKKIRDAPKLDDDTLLPSPEPFALIDDFLNPDADFESHLEDESPAEYIDFLNVGLDAFSADFFENYSKNKSAERTNKTKKK